MSVLSFITLFGGLALFLFGMNFMSANLEKLAGGKMEIILNRLTSNRVKGLLLGLGVTAVIQSSSAVTVMLVGLVNSGILDLSHTVGVIMGSNIGTTVTAWIMSLVGIQSDNVFAQMVKPETFSPVLALIGVILSMGSKTGRNKDIGNILIGFAILMYGMTAMADSVSPLADSPQFTKILTAYNNPFIGLLTGIAVTAVIQSSSASVGILQALSMTGNISVGMAIPIIMGQNIGTCVTALISSIGVSRNAKRVAVIHISFNVIGTIVFMAIFYGLHAVISFSFFEDAINPVDIALFHSIFNICTTALLLPFANFLVRIAMNTIHDEPEKQLAYLDERLLKTPSVAVTECSKMTREMAGISMESMNKAMALLFAYSSDEEEDIRRMEQEVDVYEDHLGTYLVQLSGSDLSDESSRQVSEMLHTIGNFERISDHALNLVASANEIADKSVEFSGDAKKELETAERALRDILKMTQEAFVNTDVELASHVEPLEQVIDGLLEQIKFNHVNRLKTGECTIQNGFVLQDILANYERVSDHCSNIAVAVIELQKDVFDTHEYLGQIKSMNDPGFLRMYRSYLEEYAL